jgi:hypothetical protein
MAESTDINDAVKDINSEIASADAKNNKSGDETMASLTSFDDMMISEGHRSRSTSASPDRSAPIKVTLVEQSLSPASAPPPPSPPHIVILNDGPPPPLPPQVALTPYAMEGLLFPECEAQHPDCFATQDAPDDGKRRYL